MPAQRASQFVSFALAEKLLRAAAAPSEWNLTIEQFQVTLERSASKKFCNPAPAAVDAAATEKFLSGLQLQELALACACSAGNEAAWEHFVAKYRPELHRAARAIAGDSRGRELADSIYAELFGLRESEGFRRSLFDYFHGRSKLSTWLYAILAQRHVDEIRRGRKEESLDDPPGEGRGGPAIELKTIRNDDPEREQYLAMMQAAMTSALEALAAQDRLRLAYYYVEELTLAEIGKLFGEHEATASRKLESARRKVREKVESILREERKLAEAQVQLCFQYAREEWPFDLSRALSARD
ncbi:MAG TPA: sigma-70 family RNA polymerase sigma factor [Candidatus Limnocylindrales bacterium]|jgi:RNA polymerase sigma-70 factor|nr:sigma-70 family RNA polymerase sigma factor [Candidatus Limnocylindrales bacterium]